MMFCCHVTMLQPWSYAETNAWKSQGKKQCFRSNGIKLFVQAFVMRLSKKKQAELHWWKTAAHHSNWAIMPKKVRKLQYEWFVPRNDSLKISRYKWKTETNHFLLDTNGLCKVREDYVAIKCLWVPWTDCLALGNWFQHHSFQSWCNVNIFKATDTKTGKPNGFGRPIITFENSRAQMFNLCLVKTCSAMDFCQGSVLLLKNWVW